MAQKTHLDNLCRWSSNHDSNFVLLYVCHSCIRSVVFARWRSQFWRRFEISDRF